MTDDPEGLCRAIAQALKLSESDRQTVEASLASVAGAMARVQDDKRQELQALVTAWLIDPSNAATQTRLAALLREAPRPSH